MEWKWRSNVVNFLDMLKQKMLAGWQGLQGQQQASQDWRQNVGALQQKLQPTIPNPQMPAGQGVMANLQQAGSDALNSIPTASQMDSNARAMKDKLMQSQLMQHLMGLFGGQNAR